MTKFSKPTVWIALNGLNNVNIVSSSCNNDFNVSLENHVQNIGISQRSHELDSNSLIDLRKTFTNNPTVRYWNWIWWAKLVILEKSPESCQLIFCVGPIKILSAILMVFNILLFKEIEAKMGEVKMVFLKKGILNKRLPGHETTCFL